ncbi:hypothetical protein IUY40_09295 [Flavobacterium sp. ALJ2]|uniref:hypothetical protein n=1 Tax=Flavobacterium sp. ALJ2 TaxID=2786960 RepID=UPI00189EA550|nr:hypothetical protein [Flavobacterium sp. ALJ2]MBF7091736.1 hypothetical protein [Flavobacterium sp. ALJ2]
MKFLFCCIVAFLFLISCESKEPIEVKQIESKEMVTILPSLKNPSTKDSVVISVPIEFKVTMNSSVDYVVWLYRVDNKTLWDEVVDFQVYKKQNKTDPIYQLDFDESSTNKPISIILKERNHLISKKDAQELLKKNNITRSLENLKFGDTIKLTTYDKFRNENKALIYDFEKIKDSIHFKAIRGKKESFYVVKKINW